MFELGIIFLLSLFGMSPQVIAENQLQAVVQGNNHFTKQLYDVLSKEKGNVFFSPISAHAVLAMAYQGAKGSTYEAFTTTLGMPSHNQAALGYSHIIGNLNNVTDVQLLMANKIYTKKGYALKPAFKDVVQKTFSSEVESVNFSDSAASASKINSWVEDKTQNKIKDLIKPDDLDEYTRLVLINAIYFKGNWASKFDEKKTKTEKFYLNDNDSIDVKMMNKHSDYAFKEDYDLNAKVLELPYKNPDVSLVVILPNKRNGISELETKLANVSLDKVTENMYKREVIVKFPKFKVKTTIDLKGPLQQLGLGIIFDNSADFSEMLESPEPLHVSKAVQKAFIEVNEEGTEAAAATEKDYIEKLITAVKKEVKQVMEESVTRKFVHEESGSVTSLCGAVENCLSQGLRRRALGLFKTSSTTALLHKIAKHCAEADRISKKVQEIENLDPNRRSSSSSDSVTKPTLKKNLSFPTSPLPRFLWIRLALFDKQLAKIIDYLVSNASKYYDKDALVADPDYGSILSSLLVGPCALDYSRTKSVEQFWTDPPADELVKMHRISSGHSTPPSVRRPILNFGRSLNTSSDDSLVARNNTQHIAKDYVESLHQNSRAALLFGKNNVLVMPPKDDVTEPMPGYLSLHQTTSGLTIKWTPNQLMNGFTDESQDKSIYWDYALQVRLDEIVYVHCHQDSEAGGTIILVGQDGVQRPPIHFPKGGHMLAFLSCLETGLLPRGRLDPPLWSQRSGANSTTKRRRPLPALSETEEATKDYVFRIIDNSDHKDMLKRKDLMDTKASLPTKVRVQLCSTSTSSESSSKSFSMDQQTVPDSPPSVYIQAVCDSMKKQIISRAFYGWLAYCRHLSTVRTHLSGLVNSKIISGEGASEGLTVEKWAELCIDGVVSDYAEVYRHTYFGGVANELRTEIWPYLLGHYKFGSTTEQRKELDEETKQAYENTMSEWLAVEAIVRQRDKEDQARAIAKLSSESMSGDQVPNEIQRDLSNEVFEDVITDDEDSLSEEDKLDTPNRKPKKTKQNTIKYDSDEETQPENTDAKTEEPKSNGQQNEVSERDGFENNVQSNESEALSRSRIASVDKGEASSNNCDNNDDVVVQETDSREELRDFIHNVIVTNASVDISTMENESPVRNHLDAVTEENNSSLDTCIETHGLASPARSACVSPASSNGGIYSQELLETFGLNLHRIEKDVQRCDRNYWYFANENLDKLRNVMCTYVWEHLEIGYMQGMCDLVAPLLVTFDDESLTYACFCHLMERMIENFPNGNAMDCHFANMRSLIQILDSDMYEQMQADGDYTHFNFCYRWFLLDFKRELIYPDVFTTWEVIWAAQQVASSHFVLFLALALLETYRDIILSNGMDFIDIIKFFNEMAERHDAAAILKLSRELVLQLQLLIENK